MSLVKTPAGSWRFGPFPIERPAGECVSIPAQEQRRIRGEPSLWAHPNSAYLYSKNLFYESDQSESALITSPPATLPSDRQVMPSMVLLMNRTEPSPRREFTPPGWKLREMMAA